MPQGAVSTHTTYLTLAELRSPNVVTPAGLSLGVTSTMTFVAKFFGVEASAAFALSMVSLSAVASTSAGAPPAACWASVAEESNAKVTFTPGCFFSKVPARSVNVPVSDAAASTVIVVSPLSATRRQWSDGGEEDDGRGGHGPAGQRTHGAPSIG